MKRIRRPSFWRVGPVAAYLLILAAAAPVGAAVKLTVGQELIYSGTVEWKMSQGGGPTQTFSGPLHLSAVVTEADTAKGYALIVMRHFQPEPKPGQPSPTPRRPWERSAMIPALLPPLLARCLPAGR